MHDLIYDVSNCIQAVKLQYGSDTAKDVRPPFCISLPMNSASKPSFKMKLLQKT